MVNLDNSGGRMRLHRYGLTVLKAAFAAVLLAQSIAAPAAAPEQGIDRQFIERRCGGKTNTTFSAEEKKKVLELIRKDMQGLSASPEWNPRHPKWRDIEASYVAEFEWIATRSSQLNCAADAGGVDTLLQSYRSRLPEEEQSRLAQFYSAALGQKLLDANTEVAGLIQQAHTALSLEPESIPKRVKPLTAADQERWSQVVVLSDPFRLIGVALERRLAVNPDSFSSTTRIAYSLYGAQFEAIRARFSDSDLKEVRTFQESAEAKKEIALLADYVIISMTLLSQELDRRLRKLEDLKIQWRNSAGLR